MKLSNKKIKYIKRHFLKKSPEDIAGDLRIPVREVKKALKQFGSPPSGDRSSIYRSRKTLDIPYKYHLISCFLLCLLCIIVYSNTLNSPFIFDDLPNITNSSFMRLTELDLKKVYKAAFKGPNPRRPLANLSFALNHYFWGNNVTAYHIVNIIIHMFNGILIYFIALILFKQVFSLPNQKILQYNSSTIQLMSVFSALFFISHPIQTQTVTYIVQRMNSMAAMFFLLSFLLYIHGRLEQTYWRQWILFCIGFLSWIMALGCKEIAATLPLIILIYEWYFFQNLSLAWLKKNMKYLLGFLAVLAMISILYLGGHPFEKIASAYAHRDFTMGERVLTQSRVVVFYISLLLFPLPSRLNLIHQFQISNSVLDPVTTLFSIMFVFGLIALTIYIARMQRLFSFCILWVFINLAIESSIIALELVFEHRLYLPLVGLAFSVSCLLFRFYSKRPLLIIGISIAAITALSIGTYVRNGVYENPVSLWSDVLSKNPQSHRAYNNLGIELLNRGRIREAIKHHSKALEINPQFAVAFYNLGLVYAMQGKYKEAVEHYSEALRIKPKFSEAHCNLGVALLNQGRAQEAIVHFSEALRLMPHNLAAHNSFGVALVRQGKFKEAVDHFNEALRLMPHNLEAHNNFGVALARQGKFKEAVDHFNEALRLKPDYADARENLERALIQMRKSSH